MKTLKQLPDTKPRKSEYTLDFLIRKLSGINDEFSIDPKARHDAEAILCLANEIKKIKEILKAI